MASEIFYGSLIIMRLPGLPQPELPPIGNAYIYFDQISGKIKASENGNPYVDMIGGGGGGSLQDAYDAGNAILLSGALPVSITNPGASATPVLALTQGTAGQNALSASGGDINVSGGNFVTGTTALSDGSLARTGALSIVAVGAVADLTLSARGVGTTLNQAGETVLDVAYTGVGRTSIIGALNALVDGAVTPSAPPLSSVLAVGNTTGANNIIVSAGQRIDTALAGILDLGTIGATTAVNVGSTGNPTNLPGNVTVGGNFTVNGTVTTINSANTSIADQLLIIASTTAVQVFSAYTIERGASGDDLLFLWNPTNSRTEIGFFDTVGGTVVPASALTTLSDLRANNLSVAGTAITADAALTVASTGAANDLNFTGRSATTALNQAGETVLDVAFTGAGRTSIIGALNSLVDGTVPTSSTLQNAYTAGTGAILLTLAGGPIAITNPAATAQSGLTVVQNTAGQFAIDATGDVRVTGKLTVTGLIDPTQVLLTGADKRFGATDAGSVYLAPFTNAVTGVQIRRADNVTAVLTADTTNQRIGVNTAAPAAGAALDVEGGSITCPGAGAGSERFGNGALAAGASATSIGNGATASATDTVSVGLGASATSTDSTAVGRSASASGVGGSTAIGRGASAPGSGSTAVGRGSTVSAGNSVAVGDAATANTDSVAIGASATANNAAAGVGSIAIGVAATTGAFGSIVMGRSATATASQQLIVGSSLMTVNSVYIGNGVTNAAPAFLRINATGGLGVGVVGADLDIAAGVSGDAATAGGAVHIMTARAGTGTVVTTAVTVANDGSISCLGAGVDSERFGSGALAGGANSLSAGFGADASGIQSTALGATSSASAADTVAVGRSASATASSSTAIGQGALADGSFSVVIGAGASAGGNTESIVIGTTSVSTASNQFVAGSSSRRINDVYFGKGFSDPVPTAYTIHGTGGNGAAVAGALIRVAGGVSGDAATQGGDVRLGASLAGSGTTTTDVVYVTGGGTVGRVGIGAAPGAFELDVTGDAHVSGKLTVDGAIDPTSLSLSGGTALFFDSADGATAPLSAVAHGRIRYNNGTTQWEQSVNGGAYASLGGTTVTTLAPLTGTAATAGTDATAVGVAADASGSETVAVGNTASATGAQSVVVGRNSTDSAAGTCVLIGYGITNDPGSGSNTIIGFAPTVNTGGGTAVGAATTVGGGSVVVSASGGLADHTSICIGGGNAGTDVNALECLNMGNGSAGGGAPSRTTVLVGPSGGNVNGFATGVFGGTNSQFGGGATWLGDNLVSLGFGPGEEDVTWFSSLYLGNNTVPTAQFEVVAGSSTVPATDVYFGAGVAAKNPVATTIHGTAGIIQTGAAAPSSAPTVVVVGGVGGDWAAGSYDIFYTFFDGIGETLASPTTSATIVNPGDAFDISGFTLPSLNNIVAVYVYIEDSPGSGTFRRSAANGHLGSAFLCSGYRKERFLLTPTGNPVYTGTNTTIHNGDGGILNIAGGLAASAGLTGGDLGLQVAIAGTGTTLTTIMQFLGASGDIQLNGDFNMLPAADNTWSLGSNAQRLKLVRAVTITSGAYLEEEVFPEESESLPVMIRSLARELEAKAVRVGNGFIEGVRHLAKIAMLSARAVVALEERVRALEA